MPILWARHAETCGVRRRPSSSGRGWGSKGALPDGATGIGRAEPVQTGKAGHEPSASRVARFLYWREAEDTKMQTAGQQVALEARATRKGVVVNGNPDVRELLESALDGGRYDLLFADAGQHAYSLIKREQPDLVVLSVNIGLPEGSQLRSMLKLDPATQHIAVVTYTTHGADDEPDEDDYSEERPLQTPHIPMRLH